MINNIISIINGIGIYTFNIALNTIPDWAFDITPYIQNLVNVFWYINWYFPITEVFTVFALIVTIESWWVGYNLLARIIKIVSFGLVEI